MKLIPLEREHLPYVLEMRNENISYLRQKTLLTYEQQEKWFNNNKDIYFIIEKEIPVCCIGLTHIDWQNRICEISGISKDYKLNEYINCFYNVLKYGFEELGMNKIFNETYEFDIEKKKLWKNLGFMKEAKIRKAVFKGGKYKDSEIYSMLFCEYMAIKEG